MDRAIVLASNNAGKIREIRAILRDRPILAQGQFDIPEAIESGLTFVENAIIKARNAARHSGLPAIADDSGLVVDALGGAPGLFSARYAGAGASDEENLAKLLEALGDLPDERRGARFICAIVFMRHAGDPSPVIAQGVWEGRIAREPRGKQGFGYDPLFFVPEQGCTAAELPPEVKNRLSHRGKALKSLAEQLHAPS